MSVVNVYAQDTAKTVFEGGRGELKWEQTISLIYVYHFSFVQLLFFGADFFSQIYILFQNFLFVAQVVDKNEKRFIYM